MALIGFDSSMHVVDTMIGVEMDSTGPNIYSAPSYCFALSVPIRNINKLTHNAWSQFPLAFFY